MFWLTRLRKNSTVKPHGLPSTPAMNEVPRKLAAPGGGMVGAQWLESLPRAAPQTIWNAPPHCTPRGLQNHHPVPGCRPLLHLVGVVAIILPSHPPQPSTHELDRNHRRLTNVSLDHRPERLPTRDPCSLRRTPAWVERLITHRLMCHRAYMEILGMR